MLEVGIPDPSSHCFGLWSLKLEAEVTGTGKEISYVVPTTGIWKDGVPRLDGVSLLSGRKGKSRSREREFVSGKHRVNCCQIL